MKLRRYCHKFFYFFSIFPPCLFVSFSVFSSDCSHSLFVCFFHCTAMSDSGRFGSGFCHRHLRSVSFSACLRSVSFSACLAHVLVFRMSVHPSFFKQAARGVVIFVDFLSCTNVQIKRNSMWSFVGSRRSVESDCHMCSQVSFNGFKHFDIVQKTRKVSVHALM